MTGWTVVVPVKRWALGKSRLAVTSAVRRQLARALALDLVDAVAECAAVEQLVLVTAERELHAARLCHDAVVLEDRPPPLRQSSLNGAVALGLAWARTRRPQAPLAVVPADLATVTPCALEEGLTRLGAFERAFVPDAEGSGTTVVTARHPGLLSGTAYGAGSAAEHERMGLRCVSDVDERLRLDVDTAADLLRADTVGTGPGVRAVLKQARAIGVRSAS